jgi:hypothetical protein
MARFCVSRLARELILRRADPHKVLRDEMTSAKLTGTKLHLYCTEILLLFPRRGLAKPWESAIGFLVSGEEGGYMPFSPAGPGQSGAFFPV